MGTHQLDAPLSAVDIAKHVLLQELARRLLRPDLSPRAYFDRLIFHGLWVDAIRIFPHLLPNQSAMWWGCQCLWDVARCGDSAEAKDTLRAVLRWVVNPSEAHRQAAHPVERSALKTPWGCLAMAVAWSGGSLSDPGLPVVPPPQPATARMVSGAVLLAAVQREPMRYEERHRRFLDLGLQIAAGQNLWWQPRDAGHVEMADRHDPELLLAGTPG